MKTDKQKAKAMEQMQTLLEHAGLSMDDPMTGVILAMDLLHSMQNPNKLQLIVEHNGLEDALNMVASTLVSLARKTGITKQQFLEASSRLEAAKNHFRTLSHIEGVAFESPAVLTGTPSAVQRGEPSVARC